MTDLVNASLYTPSSLTDALDVLAENGAEAVPLAGATWIMRKLNFGERAQRMYVALSALDALNRIDIDDKSIKIGSCVTHAQLSAALADLADMQVLALAAGNSANPAVREVATVGGNLMAPVGVDLVAALLSLDAEVVVAHGTEEDRLPLGQFLGVRNDFDTGTLITHVVVLRTPSVSTHIRLTMKSSNEGDPPVATVSMALSTDHKGNIARARIAVGSVEPVARRWCELENALVGQPVDPDAAEKSAAQLRETLCGRDELGVPGWYRTRVVPVLVRRAMRAIRDHTIHEQITCEERKQ